MSNTSLRRWSASLSVAACGLSLLPVAAFAQVATPPPSEVKDPSKEFTPPPQQEMQPSQPINVQPARPRQQMPELPKDVNYDVLIKKDDKGIVAPLGEPVHLAALRNNPKLPAGFIDSIADYLADRRSRLVHMAVANLDIVEKIDEGVFETAAKEDKAGLQKLMDTVKPIVQAPAPRSISDELRDKQLLDPTQWLVNTQIVRRYTLASVPPVDKNAPQAVQGAAAWGALIQLYKAMTEEYTFLLASANKTIAKESNALFSSELVTKLNGIGLDEAKLKNVRGLLEKAVTATVGTDEYKAANKAFREATTIEQRKAIYEAAMNLKPVS
jgi:hypothetical protein